MVQDDDLAPVVSAEGHTPQPWGRYSFLLTVPGGGTLRLLHDLGDTAPETEDER
ncbi:hypothetical protein AB0N60_34530 [Streptomyces microflavus]|uniref:hypothetical protein n=1 Tax=Streptomyces microflavus TaxID=1919 RepID=UPI0013DFE9C4|nr:hypothetical protein [Streptomyces microflavus]